MPLWRFTPVARPADPRWPGQRWREVVVRTETSGPAMHVADSALRPPASVAALDDTPKRTGLEDEKLYELRRVSAADAGLPTAEEAGPPAVLKAREG